MQKVVEVQDRAERFSLSMRDWQLFRMVKELIKAMMETNGGDFNTAYKTARVLMNCVSLSPSINVATGREGGVIIEHSEGMFNLIGAFEIGAGSKPTARLVLGEDKPRIRVG